MWQAIGAGLSVASGIAGFGASKDAAKAAKRLMRKQLAIHDVDAAYNEDMAEKAAEAQLSYTDAAIGASNIMFSGSAMSYRRNVRDTLAMEMKHMRTTNKLGREAIQLGGEAQVKSFKNQGIGSLLGAGMSAANYFGRPTP